MKLGPRMAGLALMATACGAVAADYMFVGIYGQRAPGRSGMCADRALERVPLDERDHYERARGEFFNRHRGQSPSVYLLTPDEAAAAFAYSKFEPGFGCVHRSISLVRGASLSDAKAQMEKLRHRNARSYRSEPELVFAWEGGAYRNLLKRDYGGVEIVLTSARTRGGSTQVFARGRNNNKEHAASVMYIVDGRLAKPPVMLQPGMTFSGPVGLFQEFEVEVRLFEPQPDSRPLDDKIVDQVKSTIRERITTGQGRMKLHSGGERG